MNAVFEFLPVARWAGGRAYGAVGLVGLAALLEGTALVALAPIFNQQLSADANMAGATLRLAQLLSIAPGNILPFSLALFAAFGLCSAAVRTAADSLLLWIRTRVEEITRNRMTDALMRVRWEAFAEVKLGEIGKSIYQESWYIGVGVQVTLQALGLLVAVLLYLGIAALISPSLTAIALLLGAGLAFAVRALSRRARSHTERFMTLNSDLSNRVQELFSNLKFYRSAGMVNKAREIGGQLFRGFAHSYFRAYVLSPMARFFVEGAALLFIAFILYAGLVVSQTDLAGIIIFLALFLRASPRINTLQDLLFQAGTYLGWYRDWKKRLDFAEKNVELDSGTAEVDFHDQVSIDSVCVTYPGRDRPALEGVNARIGAREFVAIVGPSGSGKSTIIDLVTGVLRPTAGQVNVDGTDLLKISLDAWRRRIGIVLQETPLFYGTVLDNVTWGAGHKDEARALASLERAHASHIIAKIDGGLHGEVGERGARLSGGERQRLALARALYRKPQILILDEATSALDSLAEQEILKAIRALKGGCAILVVAHRLSAVRDADRILVLEQGRIVEQGDWPTLMRRPDGVLRAMAQRQNVPMAG
jgi:ATP-binding cassette, subfamily C, bacterial